MRDGQRLLNSEPTIQARTSPEPHEPGHLDPRTEIRSLTGLRFIAAIAVVIHHIRPPANSPRWLADIIDHGFVGVPLFFMLSGLVLAWNYPRLSVHKGRRTILFYIARIARVMPLYWVVLTWLVLRRAVIEVPQEEVWRHYLGIQTWSGSLDIGARGYNAPAWSINVELFLYLLFPFLVPIVRRISAKGISSLVWVAVSMFAIQMLLVAVFTMTGWAELPAADASSGHRWLYRNPLTRIPDFVIGISMGFMLIRKPLITQRRATILQAGVVAVIAAMLAIPNSGDTPWLRASFYAAAFTVPFALLIFSLAAGPSGWFSRVLSTAPLRTLGLASYALYLTHRPLLPAFGHDQVHAASTGPLESWLSALAIVVLCLLVAEGAHRYIENPARAWITTVARRHLSPATSPPATEPKIAEDTVNTQRR